MSWSSIRSIAASAGLVMALGVPGQGVPSQDSATLTVAVSVVAGVTVAPPQLVEALPTPHPARRMRAVAAQPTAMQMAALAALGGREEKSGELQCVEYRATSVSAWSEEMKSLPGATLCTWTVIPD